jgi:hypothetical protein
LKSLIIFPACVLLSATCKKPGDNGKHLLIESSFEGSNPLEGWMNQQHCCDYSVTQSPARVTGGSNSLRIEVRSTDPQSSNSIRSEIIQGGDPVGTERWYGFNLYLEDWVADDAGECVFQWHPENSRGTATASLWTSSGRYVFQTNLGGNSVSVYTDLGPILSNQWVSWVIHVKWAVDNSGILQVWKNGELVIDRPGIATCPPEGTYFKLGINKFGWGIQASASTRRVLYFDEVRIGDEEATYTDVKPDP